MILCLLAYEGIFWTFQKLRINDVKHNFSDREIRDYTQRSIINNRISDWDRISEEDVQLLVQTAFIFQRTVRPNLVPSVPISAPRMELVPVHQRITPLQVQDTIIAEIQRRHLEQLRLAQILNKPILIEEVDDTIIDEEMTNAEEFSAEQFMSSDTEMFDAHLVQAQADELEKMLTQTENIQEDIPESSNIISDQTMTEAAEEANEKAHDESQDQGDKLEERLTQTEIIHEDIPEFTNTASDQVMTEANAESLDPPQQAQSVQAPVMQEPITQQPIQQHSDSILCQSAPKSPLRTTSCGPTFLQYQEQITQEEVFESIDRQSVQNEASSSSQTSQQMGYAPMVTYATPGALTTVNTSNLDAPVTRSELLHILNQEAENRRRRDEQEAEYRRKIEEENAETRRLLAETTAASNTRTDKLFELLVEKDKKQEETNANIMNMMSRFFQHFPPPPNTDADKRGESSTQGGVNPGDKDKDKQA